MMVTFKVEGVVEIIAELYNRLATLRALAPDLMEQYGEHTRDLTAQLAPFDWEEKYDTFHMREEIEVDLDPDGLGFEVGWREETFRTAGFYPYYLVQEFGSVFQPQPQPSLGPAWAELEPHFLEDARDLVEATISKGE